MTLSQIRRLLSDQGIQLTKSLGQNFLHDQNQLRRIVAAADLTKADKVLEIGPGLGPLTELLLETASEVLAIENDARLVKLLHERFCPGQPPLPLARGETIALRPREHSQTASTGAQGPKPGSTPALHVIHDDALDYIRREPRDWTGWKMVSNLPYSVASPILVELARNLQGPQRIVATLQLEVARRLTAAVGEADYGLLTLLVQLDYEAALLFKIPASCFFPEPGVDSACVCLVRRPQPLLDEPERGVFLRLVKQAFSQRRKMMLKLLKSHWSAVDLERAFRLAGVSASVRAESVSLKQFVCLAKALSTNSAHG